jgi:transcriptional regulator with XRE-family HTH domain
MNGKYLQSLRQSIGFSQRDLALLLNCSPALIALTERGKRFLPREAEAFCRELADMVEKGTQPVAAEKILNTRLTLFIDKQLRLLRLRLARQELKFETLQQQTQYLQLRGHWLPQMQVLTVMEGESLSAQVALLLERQCREKLDRMIPLLLQTEMEIVGLKAEIAGWEQMK